MTNIPGKKDAEFRERGQLSASELMRLVQMSLKRIVPGVGIGIRTINNQVVISAKDISGGAGVREPEPEPTLEENYYIQVEDLNNPGHLFYIKTSPCDKSAGGNSFNFLAGLFRPWLGVGFGETGPMDEMTQDTFPGAYRIELFLGDTCPSPPGKPPEGSWDIETPTRIFVGVKTAAGLPIADGARLWSIAKWDCLTVDPIDTLLP